MNKEKQVVTLTTSELLVTLLTVKVGEFGYIEMNTIPKMNKRNNPLFGEVTKSTKLRMYFGCNYQKRMIKETENVEFVPKECSVGRRIGESCVYRNERLNRHYFQYEQFDEVKPQTEFFRNGVVMNEVEKGIMRGFFPTYTPSTINFRLVNIENITRLHINKVEYVIENEVEVEI